MAARMIKRTFTLPRDLVARLEGQPNKSELVRTALLRELARQEREALDRRLLEAYTGRRKGLAAEINREWEPATLENWPEP